MSLSSNYAVLGIIKIINSPQKKHTRKGGIKTKKKERKNRQLMHPV